MDEHRSRLDLPERRLRARRAGALLDFASEHGEGGVRAVGGRRAAERLLEAQDARLDEQALVGVLEGAMSSHAVPKRGTTTRGRTP